MKVNVYSLKVDQLNKLLKHKKLSLSGNKADKIARLVEAYETEDVEVDEELLQEDLQGFDEQANEWRQQITDLRNIVIGLAHSVNQLTASSRNTEQVTNTQEVQINESLQANCSANDNEGACGGVPSGSIPTVGVSGALKDYIVMIPDFDPIKKTISSTQFVDKIEKLQLIHKWTDDTILFAVYYKMKGLAKSWIDSLPVLETWAQFKQLFLNDFPSKVSIADVHRELMARKRSYGESLVEYYYCMLAIGRKGNVDDYSILSYIINGVNDTSITRILLAMNLQTCNDLLKSLENISTIMPAKKVTDKGVDEMKIATARQVNECKGPKCFNCNNYGHIAIKCPQPQKKQKCTICSKVGHDERQCRVKPTVAIVNDKNIEVCPPVLKQIFINEHEFLAFADIGSQFTLIRESSVPRNVTTKRISKTMSGFGQGVVEAKQMCECTVTIDGNSIKSKIYVIHDNFMPYDLILGRDVLCNEDHRLTIESGVLRIEALSDTNYNINQNISNGQRIVIQDLLNSFDVCFSESLEKLGHCKNTHMDITVSSDGPITGKRYQVPFSQRQMLSDIIDNLLKYDIIRPSISPHAAPVLLVQKSNGEHRMCTDYRALNAVTVKKQYCMPVVEEQLSLLAGNKYFTTLDMTSGYYQVPLTEDSKKYTAFITPEGLYEYNVMPFGLINAPMVFQEMITQLIRKMKHRRNIISYVDEVIIVSKTVEQSVEVLKEFLAAVKDEGLTLRPSKCSFMQTTVNFLGHVINANGICPGEEETKWCS